MPPFGPFHRKKSPTQDHGTAVLQQRSGEIWGKPIKNGGLFPKVKAYLRPLCAGEPAGTDCHAGDGIEFVTAVMPQQVWPTGMVLWTMDNGPVAGIRLVDQDTIALAVDVTKVVYR
ncbi:hypothetical protein [Jiella sp. M17.18]|uniref:hypothetical protein n=1 Tax=Jiella sp. M17.18 TaxID=3234247 RepID=UPI0034DF20E7